MKYNGNINSELIEADEQRVDSGPENIYTDDTEEVERISKDIVFEWQHPSKILRGRERFLWLCEKLGLPKKKKP